MIKLKPSKPNIVLGFAILRLDFSVPNKGINYSKYLALPDEACRLWQQDNHPIEFFVVLYRD